MSQAAETLLEQAREARRYGDAGGSLLLYRQAAHAFGGDATGRAHCLRHIADLLREQGKGDEARPMLHEARTLYETKVEDTLSLANTVRLLAIVDDDRDLWQQARVLYERAAQEGGFDLRPALAECDRHL